MDRDTAQALLGQVLAPWVGALGLQVESVDDRHSVLRLPFSDELRHAGGVVCGQVFMAAADTAMIVAISAALGGFRPMTTVSLTTQFMRAVRQGDTRVSARVLRLGRNLVFGEIEIHDESGEMAVHATTTYALL